MCRWDGRRSPIFLLLLILLLAAGIGVSILMIQNQYNLQTLIFLLIVLAAIWTVFGMIMVLFIQSCARDGEWTPGGAAESGSGAGPGSGGFPVGVYESMCRSTRPPPPPPPRDDWYEQPDRGNGTGGPDDIYENL